MKVELTNEQMEAIAYGDDLIVDNEKWEYIEQDEDTEEDGQGKYETHIFKRPSDGKYFSIMVTYAKYGYEDYGYEEFMQDLVAHEVKKKKIVKTEWVLV